MIIACNPTHPAQSALWASNGSYADHCTLEAMRTQGLFSFFIWLRSRRHERLSWWFTRSFPCRDHICRSHWTQEQPV